jgi:hypothetical protein
MHLPLVLLTLAVLAAQSRLEPWMAMCSMAVAVYAGCKWVTFAEAYERGHRVGRTVGYLLLWPGMDAAAFLRGHVASPPRTTEWTMAGCRTLVGVALIWGIAPALVTRAPLVAGWVAMTGMICLLHFGTFHLLSLTWRLAGVDARPLMNQPLRATSLAEFWGRRWNVAFHQLASRYIFRPSLTVVGPRAASIVVFLASGLIHELAISVPAGGGYGLPTGYFLLQGMGLAFERSAVGRRFGLGRGRRGWMLMAIMTAGPAFYLFPPIFVHRVILPMLPLIGAR